MEYPLLFLLGGGLYVVLELFWRGRTHVSMALAGGASLVLLYGVFTRLPIESALLRCLAGSVIITAVEFITGYFVNIRKGLNVWDYSALRFNLYGQISLRYSLLWAGLTAPASVIIDVVYSSVQL